MPATDPSDAASDDPVPDDQATGGAAPPDGEAPPAEEAADHDPSPGPTPLAADGVRGIEYRVPEGETPAGRCDRCGRPFRTEQALALHRGEVHDDLDATEAAAYEAAREQERDELFFFHIRTVVVLGVLYAISVVVYMAVLGGGI
jgi:hypothetical protein